MNSIIESFYITTQAIERKEYERALVDLRLVIERYTQNRYGEDEVDSYLLLLRDKNLIDLKLRDNDIVIIKPLLFFILFNYPDRAVLAAKCIKVLFDRSIWTAICAGIDIYMKVDDDTTCELIFAITDIGDDSYFSDKRIVKMFSEVARIGGLYSKEAAILQINIMSEQNISPGL